MIDRPRHIEQFLQYLEFEKRYSAHTLTSYQTDLGQFVSFITQIYDLQEWQSVQGMHVRAWMVYLLDQGLSERSINRKFSALKSFFKFLKRHNNLTTDPMKKVVAPKVRKRLPEFLREGQTELLFSKVVFPEGFEGLRDRLVLELLYQTGLRRSELVRLRDTDLDRSAGWLRVKGKGGKTRLVPVTGPLVQLIDAYREIREAADFEAAPELLRTDAGKAMYPKFVYNLVRRYLSQVTTAEKRSPHVLRHTFATHLANRGADLNVIKELLGHSSLAATQVYTHNTVEKLKAVYRQAHPKAGGHPEGDHTEN